MPCEKLHVLLDRKHEIEFARQDWFSENKQILTALACIAICCILCGAVICFTFEFAGGAKESMDTMTAAIKGIGNITGNAPM